MTDRAFCPIDGVGVGFDEDGCCTSCGATVCSVTELLEHLARAGMRVVGPVPPPPTPSGRACSAPGVEPPPSVELTDISEVADWQSLKDERR